MLLRPAMFLLLSIMLLISCQNSPEPAIEFVNDTKVIKQLNQSIPEEDVFEIKWGDIILPIEKYANPNGFKGDTEVERATILAALEQPLMLYKNNLPLDIEIHTVYNYTDGWRDSKWKPNPSENQRDLNPDVIESLRATVQKGDKIVIHLGSVNKEVYVAGAGINIKDPYQAYEPEKRVKWQRSNENAFGFQVISQEGKESVLRIDTAAEATAKVYDLYKDRKDYKILHIPNFATQRRLVIDEDEIFSKYDIRRTELFNNEFDRWTLSEFTDYYRRWVHLDWGEMQAYANSENYSVSTFLQSIKKELVLNVDKRVVPILGFDLIIKGGEKPPIRFITNQLDIPEIKKALSEVPSKSSIYFTNIIVDDAGETKHFPLHFAFHIDDPLPFDLDIAEAEAESLITDYTAEFTDSAYQISYKNYRLTDVVAHLVDLPADEVFFNQFKRNPVVNICFASKTLPLEYGKKAIQRALEKEYNIKFNWSWHDYYKLTAIAPELLDGYRQSEEKESARQFNYNLDEDTKIADLTYANLFQMAWRVGGEFRISIVNTTDIEGTFNMSIDMQSVDDLQRNLFEQYGLELTKMTEEIKTVAYQMEIQ
ncbi:MAG: hypothetical protein AB8G22_01210 [Saprospiraceae bacterium]